jgi:hypothetical protein
MQQTIPNLCVLERVLPPASPSLHPRSELSCHPSPRLCACRQARMRQRYTNLCVLETALPPASPSPHPRFELSCQRARDYAPAIRRECDRPYPSVCPRNGSPTSFPVSASQIRTVLSPEPETTRLPSGENATDNTVICVSSKRLSHRLPRLCIPDPNCLVMRSRDYAPAIRRECDRPYPICVSSKRLSHRLPRLCIPDPNCLSPDPETMRLPSGENATDVPNLCVLEMALPPASPSPHPRSELSCQPSPRLCACHQARMPLTSTELCVSLHYKHTTWQGIQSLDENTRFYTYNL